VTAPTLGERVAEYRRHRGLSQRELAAAVKRSESWVSQVERDVQPVERLSVLHTLAQALGVSVRELRPDAVAEDGDPARPTDLDGLRLHLSGHPALARLFATDGRRPEPIGLDRLRHQVDEAWALAHDSRFAALNDALTDLLPRLEDALRGAQGDDAAELHALRARAYQAASAAFARQDEPDAAWVAADRAITAAEQSGRPLDVIAGHFRMAHAFIRLGRYDQAERVTTSALDALQPIATASDARPEALSLLGAMHLVQAIISGHEADRATARHHLAEAQRVAQQLGQDRNDFDTEFGPTNVQLHTVAVAVEVGDAGEAIDVASHIDASRLSPERQARLLIDVARAHVQRRHPGEAIAALLDAERLTPEHIRSHHLARTTISDLLDHFGRRPPAELLDLARRSGATP
jgi:transcriptional regulator with XRE-family HTH domain